MEPVTLRSVDLLHENQFAASSLWFSRVGVRKRACLCASIIGLVSVVFTGHLACAAEKDLGAFKAWRAHAFADGKARVCSMWSQPTSAVGKYVRRGEIFAFITHGPAKNARNEVSFEMGYKFKPGVKLSVLVGKQSFRLATSGSTAWGHNKNVSAALVRAMKAGKKMIVVGVSKRETKTTDTYSLFGFSAAHRAISKACK